MTSLHLDPLVLLALALAAVIYWRGLRVVRVAPWRPVAFYAGLVTFGVALISPLATLAEQLFLAHMVQHLLLIMVGAPLVLLGGPALVLSRGLPREIRNVYLVPLARSPAAHAFVRLALNPLIALGAYVVLLTLWHLPPLYDAAVTDAIVHAIEHCPSTQSGALARQSPVVVQPPPYAAVHGGEHENADRGADEEQDGAAVPGREHGERGVGPR